MSDKQIPIKNKLVECGFAKKFIENKWAERERERGGGIERERLAHKQQFYQLNCLFCIHTECRELCRMNQFLSSLFNLFDFEFVNFFRYLIKAATNVYVLLERADTHSKTFSNGKVWHRTRLQQQPWVRKKNAVYSYRIEHMNAEYGMDGKKCKNLFLKLV